MSFRYEVRLSGEGGQGLVLAGKVLAEAAAIYDDMNATQSQSYGPEARGGASRSEVIISDEDIDYPKAVNIDLLLEIPLCDLRRHHGERLNRRYDPADEDYKKGNQEEKRRDADHKGRQRLGLYAVRGRP